MALKVLLALAVCGSASAFVTPQTSLRGVSSAPTRSAAARRNMIVSEIEQEDKSTSGMSAFLCAAAVGLAVAFTGTPALAEEAAAPAPPKGDKEVRTVITKAERVAKAKAQVSKEAAKLYRPDGLIKNGQ